MPDVCSILCGPCIRKDQDDNAVTVKQDVSRFEKKIIEPQASEKMESKRKPVEEEEEEEEDEVVEKSSYDTLVEMISGLWETAASYLMPEEQDEYKREHMEAIKRMSTKELREHVKAEKDLNNAMETVLDDEEFDGHDIAAAQRQSMKVAQGMDTFDGDHFAALLSASLDESSGMVGAEKFIAACNAVPALMSGLGRTFEFASSDLANKLKVAQKRMEETAQDLEVDLGKVTLQDMVERDIRNKKTHAGKKAAPASRTILRLMWFLDFIGALLNGVAKNQNEKLKTICSQAYEETLAPRHPWILRKAARSGMGLLPPKEVFRKRLGTENMSVTEESRKLEEWASEATRVAEVMWTYMKSKGLEELP